MTIFSWFAAGFNYDINSLDLTVVRLCFQVFLKDDNGKFTKVGKPAVSQCIYDKSKCMYCVAVDLKFMLKKM